MEIDGETARLYILNVWKPRPDHSESSRPFSDLITTTHIRIEAVHWGVNILWHGT